MSATPKPGTITWQDLTVGDAEAIRDFYAAVVGWTPESVKMGE
jgi:predicted enzyme related to lactoylglutathione lyase